MSTRAVGFSVVRTFNAVTSIPVNQDRLPQMTIFQFYRVMLAMVEKKIFENRQSAKLDDGALWYDPRPFENFKSTIISMNLTTQQIGALIQSIGTFKFQDSSVVPLTPAFEAENGRDLPSPELMVLTTLRSTVVALTGMNVPIAVRRNFVAKNPIPGAQFDTQARLLNTDAIMPNNYNDQRRPIRSKTVD